MSMLSKLWKNLSVKDQVNAKVEELILKARPIIVGAILKKLNSNQLAEEITDEIVAALMALKDKIW